MGSESHYPHVPGTYPVHTSIAAADAATPGNATLKELCLAAITSKPMSMHEVASHVGRSTYSVGPAVTQLRRTGMIRDTGFLATNISGKKAIVWEAIPGAIPIEIPVTIRKRWVLAAPAGCPVALYGPYKSEAARATALIGLLASGITGLHNLDVGSRGYLDITPLE